MKSKRELLPKSLAAMIAVEALPGSPLYTGEDQKIIDSALRDLEIYKDAGVQSVFLENDFDVPYIQPPLPQKALNLMTRIAKMVRASFDGAIGIQMLEAANESSLKIAKEADLDFVRVEGFLFAQIGTSGIIEGCAPSLLRTRKKLNATNIKLLVDVKKKHSAHAITADIDITDEIKQAELCLADGIVITSKFTGEPPSISDFEKAKKVTGLPLVVGSGMTHQNVTDYLPLAELFIVGSTFRKEGKFLEQIDVDRVSQFSEIFLSERERHL